MGRYRLQHYKTIAIYEQSFKDRNFDAFNAEAASDGRDEAHNYGSVATTAEGLHAKRFCQGSGLWRGILAGLGGCW